MKNILFFPFFLIGFCAAGQNLVPDPGFEIHNADCNTNPPGLTHWFNPNTATPDLWSMSGCGNNIPQLQAADVPCPLPYEGNGYAGLFTSTTNSTVNHTRDYFYCQLTEELQAGVEYRVAFWVYRRLQYSLAIDKLGIAFTDAAPFFNTFMVIPLEPQLETAGEVIQTDSSYWQLIEFMFTASGGERYLTLGNFRLPNEMTIVNTGSGEFNGQSYHFFDEVVVESTVSVTNNQKQLDSKAWYNHEQLYIECSVASQYTIYDVLGRQIASGQLNPGLHVHAVGSLARGVYVVAIWSNNKMKAVKIWKE